MHIKYYLTHPETIELKEYYIKNLKIILKIVSRTYKKYTKYTKKTKNNTNKKFQLLK